MIENTNENEKPFELPVAARFDLGLEDKLKILISDPERYLFEKIPFEMPRVENCKLFARVGNSRMNSRMTEIYLPEQNIAIKVPQPIQINRNSIIGLAVNEAQFSHLVNEKIHNYFLKDSTVDLSLSEFVRYLEFLKEYTALDLFKDQEFKFPLFGSLMIYSDVDSSELKKIKMKSEFDIYANLHNELEKIATQTIYLDRESMEKK